MNELLEDRLEFFTRNVGNKNLSLNCQRNKLYFYLLTLMIIHITHTQNYFSIFLAGVKSISSGKVAVN